MNLFKARKLGMFYRQLSGMLGAGIPILDALESISNQPGADSMQAIALCLKQNVAQGVPLDEAFGRFSHTFVPWHVNVIKYSEKAGHLAQGFEMLAAYLEKEYSTQMGVMVKLAYPVLLLHAIFLMLPLANGITCGLGGYVSGLLRLVLPVYAVVFLAWIGVRFAQSSGCKRGFDQALAGLPMFGGLIRKLALARFVRALRCVSSAGVPIVSAWNMASESCGNGYIQKALRNASVIIERGEPVSKALVQAGLFDHQSVSMVASAEKSGMISQVLSAISSYYEKETDTAIGIISGVLPVLVYLIVAAFIAVRVISFYTGYFARLTSFGG